MPPRAAARPGALRERSFHAWVAAHLPAGRRGLLPLGDDAAALVPRPGSVLVATVDALVGGTHFLATSPPARVGAAATGVSLSDLAAKGATPAALLLAIVVPPGTQAAWAQAVVRGAERSASAFGAHVLGGDTKPGPVRAVVSTALGWSDPHRLAPRSGARPGDVLLTTGIVGRGGVAAERLRREGPSSRRAAAGLVAVQPRVREGRALARFAHAMLDTSDGLAEAARLLSRGSRVRVVVDETRLPLAPAIGRIARSATERRRLAFFGGDYELLAAVAPRDVARAERAVGAVGGRLTRVGVVTSGRGAFLQAGGRTLAMPASGWQPFAP